MTIIEQIKAEIERLKEDVPCRYHPYSCASVLEAYEELLSFLSTLESEKPMNPSEHCDPCGLRGPSGVDGDKNWYLLDQEIIDWCEKFNPSIQEEIQSTAYHFADWQKEQMMKEAVEGHVVSRNDGWNSIELPSTFFGELSKKYKDGDKVRIIIVKEEN